MFGKNKDNHGAIAASYQLKRKVTREPSNERERRIDSMQKAWYRYSGNKLSVVGLAIVCLVLIMAIFAPFIAPYPEHAGAYTNFKDALKGPCSTYLFGTDNVGRDILSRIIFAFREALLMPAMVLVIAVPFGSFWGLVAGYKKGTLLETVIMRVTDVFLSVPAMLLALAIASVLKPNMTNAMLAITIMWWPWYTRITYGVASSVRNEYFVIEANLIGASTGHILFKEILPNCYSAIFTKLALDIGFIILIGASLSFVGLGTQPPDPSLGQMISDGRRYLPENWWMTIFPSLGVVLVILGFNFLGDGLGDVLTKGGNKND